MMLALLFLGLVPLALLPDYLSSDDEDAPDAGHDDISLPGDAEEMLQNILEPVDEVDVDDGDDTPISGEILTPVDLADEAGYGSDVDVVPSEDGADSEVFVEDMLVCVLTGVPNASTSDVIAEIGIIES